MLPTEEAKAQKNEVTLRIVWWSTTRTGVMKTRDPHCNPTPALSPYPSLPAKGQQYISRDFLLCW